MRDVALGCSAVMVHACIGPPRSWFSNFLSLRVSFLLVGGVRLPFNGRVLLGSLQAWLISFLKDHLKLL